jgi:uncharacterized protein
MILPAIGWGIFGTYIRRAADPLPTDSNHVTTNAIDEPEKAAVPKSPSEVFVDRLVAAAVERTTHRVTYDPAYVPLDYPGGDVPDDRGVCADVIVRAYRAVGIDLQREVHEDMRANFRAYPQLWDLSKPDPNIDHRRVPNLQRFFERKGRSLPARQTADDVLPGDIVAWQFTGGRRHIGLVIDRRSTDGERPLVVHNVGSGPRAEDVLLSWPIIGHYRYSGHPAGASRR